MSDAYLDSVLNELVDLSDEDRVVVGGALRDWYESEPADELPPVAIAAAELRLRLGLPDPEPAVSETGEPVEATDGDSDRRTTTNPLMAAGLVLVLVGLTGALGSWWRADMNIAIEQLELSGPALGVAQASSGSTCSQGEMVISGLIRSDSGVVLKGVTVAELGSSSSGSGAVLVGSQVKARTQDETSSIEGYELAGGQYFNDEIELVYEVDDCEEIARGLVGEPQLVVSYRYLGRDRQLTLTAPITTVQQSGGS